MPTRGQREAAQSITRERICATLQNDSRGTVELHHIRYSRLEHLKQTNEIESAYFLVSTQTASQMIQKVIIGDLHKLYKFPQVHAKNKQLFKATKN